MYRLVAFLSAVGVGGAAATYVYVNLDEILTRWAITLGVSAGVLVGVTLLLYLPLLRHIADEIEERFSTVGVRLTARKTGLDLNDIPQSTDRSRRRNTTSSNKALCSICGKPGGPVCDACTDRMARK